MIKHPVYDIDGSLSFEADIDCPKDAALSQKLRLSVLFAIKHGISLRDANLREADLSGLDLSKVDLRGSYLCDADLRGSNLRGSDLSCADLTCADFSGADLTEVYLDENTKVLLAEVKS